MPAEVESIRVINYKGVCSEHPDQYIGRGPSYTYVQIQVARHNRFCHADPPIPHRIEDARPKLVGWTVECECGAIQDSDGPNPENWRCPLDQTVP